MIVGNVYASLKKSGNPTIPLLQNEIDFLFVPLADKDVDGNVFGLVLRALDSKLVNDIAQSVYVEYSAPRNLNTNEKIKNWFTSQFQINMFDFKNLPSSEVLNLVSTYVPSSKLWAAIGDEYERVKPAPMGKTITDSTVGMPSTSNLTWDKTFDVGDKVKVRIDMVNANGLTYDSPENEYEITEIYPPDKYAIRPENPTGVMYKLSGNGGGWEGKDIELFGTKTITPPVIPSKKHTIVGWVEKEEYVDYKTGKGVNVQPYPVGINFDDTVAYLNGLANTKLGLEQIFIGKDVKDSVKETLKNFLLNNIEISSWSVNGIKPYNLVIYKPEKPELTYAALEAYQPNKAEISEIKKVLGSEVDDEFATRVAAMDWKKISGLKKRSPEVFSKFVEALAAIFDDYKIEQGIDPNIVETISFDSPDLADELVKYNVFDKFLLGKVNITSFDNVKTSDQVTYYSFWGNDVADLNALINSVANEVGGYTLQQILAGETSDMTFAITGTRMGKEQIGDWADRKVIVAIPAYQSALFEKRLKEQAAETGLATREPEPEPKPETIKKTIEEIEKKYENIEFNF